MLTVAYVADLFTLLAVVCCQVCVADVLDDVGKAAVSEMTAEHGADRVIYVTCDVTKQEQFESTWAAGLPLMGLT